MQAQKTLSQLFQDKPERWGMRGDPHLWREMQAALGHRAYPDTEEQLRLLLEQAYQQLTGMPLANRDPFFIERFSHGGMSSGYVFPPFWAEQAIPLLLARYRATNIHR
jgi:molybdenum cofactor cytidylyltransferase